MLVESYDRFQMIGEFDPASGALREFKRDEAPPELLAEPVRGHYASLEGVQAILYRSDGTLWLRLDGEARPLALDAKNARWSRHGDRSRLILLGNGDTIASVEYRPGPAGPPLRDDPTPFVESEDWDFGLFVQNVVTNPDRASLIYSDGED
jgi:hypothetical protein